MCARVSKALDRPAQVFLGSADARCWLTTLLSPFKPKTSHPNERAVHISFQCTTGGLLGAALAPLRLSACVSSVISMLLGTNDTWPSNWSVLLYSVRATSMLHCSCMVPVLCTSSCGRWTSLVLRMSSGMLWRIGCAGVIMFIHRLKSPKRLEQM